MIPRMQNTVRNFSLLWNYRPFDLPLILPNTNDL